MYWSEIILLSQHPGGSVVHSYGRLIPHEFPITDLQQISGPDGIGRITCIVSNGTAEFNIPVRETKIGEMNQAAVLVVNTTSDSYQNKDLYCNSNDTNYFYLCLNSSNNSEYKHTQSGVTLSKMNLLHHTTSLLHMYVQYSTYCNSIS